MLEVALRLVPIPKNCGRMTGRRGGYRGPRGPSAPPDKWRGQCRAAERRKTPRAQVARSAAAAVTLAAISAGSLSILESEAVRPATAALYRRYANQFLDYCLTEGHTWQDLLGLDQTLVVYFTALFAEDYDSAVGSTTQAAVRHFLPDIGSKKVSPLPRSDRALRGWKALLPPAQRLPLPRAAAGAIAGVMINTGRPILGLFVLLCFSTYLRPGEAIRLRKRDLVIPQDHAGPTFAKWGLIVNNAEDGRPGKTGLTDEAVILDMNDWLLLPLLALVSGLGPMDLMWNFTMAELRTAFYAAVATLNMGALRPQLYCLRHGGASHDLLTGRRTLAEVKTRGRWQSDSSLKRYGKPTRLQAAISSLAKDTYEYGEMVIGNLGACIALAHTRGPGSLPPPRPA